MTTDPVVAAVEANRARRVAEALGVPADGARLVRGPESDLDGAELADALVAFLQRYVVMSVHQSIAVALWIIHTHAFAAAHTTPYLHITSAVMRSGKSRLLEALALLVRSPLMVSNISDAALFRAIEQLQPALLFDEIDAIFGPKARDREDLRGMLNAGWRPGVPSLRVGGAKMTELQAFKVFCPKAFTGLGDLPTTTADRTIRIHLERRTPDEKIERFRQRPVALLAEPLYEQAARWADAHLDTLTDSWPNLPDELDDRAQDVWEPLLAIADELGGEWPARARTAAITLSTGEVREDDSLSTRLLNDVREVFDAGVEDKYRTADLIALLSEIEESPWGDYYGKPISVQGLSKLLKPYRIKTMPVWIDGTTVRGYKREQFENTWLRVLGVRGVRSVRSGSSTDEAPNTPNAPNAPNALCAMGGESE